jgi:hypothetical protein
VVGFLKRSNGKARSEALVYYFNKEHKDVPGDLFKRTLQSVATLQEVPRRGGSVWHLKKELK